MAHSAEDTKVSSRSQHAVLNSIQHDSVDNVIHPKYDEESRSVTSRRIASENAPFEPSPIPVQVINERYSYEEVDACGDHKASGE